MPRKKKTEDKSFSGWTVINRGTYMEVRERGYEVKGRYRTWLRYYRPVRRAIDLDQSRLMYVPYKQVVVGVDASYKNTGLVFMLVGRCDRQEDREAFLGEARISGAWLWEGVYRDGESEYPVCALLLGIMNLGTIVEKGKGKTIKDKGERIASIVEGIIHGFTILKGAGDNANAINIAFGFSLPILFNVESVFYRAQRSAVGSDLAMLHGGLIYAFSSETDEYGRKYDYRYTTANQARASVIGNTHAKGRAKVKEQVMEWMREQLGEFQLEIMFDKHPLKKVDLDDNNADAMVLALDGALYVVKQWVDKEKGDGE